jgi:glycosyltransferase involved in cell wall biosynthesis
MPDSEKQETSQRILLCLVADEEIMDAMPTALRYLQVGLIDEHVAVALVMPEELRRSPSLTAGPTTLLTVPSGPWPIRRLVRRRAAAGLARRIEAMRGNGPVLVHALSESAAALAVELAAMCDVRMMITIRSRGNWLRSQEGQRALGRAECVLAPSPMLADHAAEGVIRGDRIRVVPWGVGVGTAPASFSRDDRDPTFMAAGRLEEDGEWDTLLRAFRRVLEHHSRSLLFIAGRGAAESNLRRLVASLGMTQSVTLTGRLVEVRSALDAADVFVVPGGRSAYREETLHAIGAGLAVIISDDAPYDGLDDGRQALHFAEGDEESMADCMLRVLEDPAAARRIAAAAQSYARAHHSAAKMVAAHAGVYRDLCAKDLTLTLNSGGSPARA